MLLNVKKREERRGYSCLILTYWVLESETTTTTKTIKQNKDKKNEKKQKTKKNTNLEMRTQYPPDHKPRVTRATG